MRAEKNFNINMKKITAVLCAIVAVLSIVFFFAGKPTAALNRIVNDISYAQTEIEEKEEYIVDQQEEISSEEALLATKKAEMERIKPEADAATAAYNEAKNALDAAEDALDEKCYRSSYSYYSCRYNSCEALHTAVSEKEAALNKVETENYTILSTVNTLENAISTAEENIRQAKSNITAAESRIESLEEELQELRKERNGLRFGLFFRIICIAIVAGALGFLTKILWEDLQDTNWKVYTIGGLAGASLLYLLANLFTGATLLSVIINPHMFNIGMMACFAAVLLDWDAKPRIMRLLAVIAAVLIAALGFLAGNVLVAFVYAVAMICLAFIIVPLDYTEYIPIYKHIFLSIITLGIWQLVWIYFVTKNLNKVSGTDSRNPSWELLMCMLLPFYFLYWLLKTAETVEFYGVENEKTFKLEAFILAFGLICPLFATILIQNKINLIVGKPAEIEDEAAEEDFVEA